MRVIALSSRGASAAAWSIQACLCVYQSALLAPTAAAH